VAPKVPQFRLHKASGQGFVELNGRRIYLGKHDLPETRENYRRTVTEWLANNRQAPGASPHLPVSVLIARYWKDRQTYYVDALGHPTGELAPLRASMRPLDELYGSTPADDFGPRALKAVRQRMIDIGWHRKTINGHVARIKALFRWAVENELVSGEVFHALQAVSGLRYGRSTAKESEPVRPVSLEDVKAIRPHVSRQVWGLIQLQLFTAARAGELVILRPCDVDRTGTVWTYTPMTHKTAHHGHTRTIYLGPQAQEVLKPFLFRLPEAFCFSPIEAEAERRREMNARRKTPPSCGNSPGTNRVRKPAVKPGGRYTVTSYARAIRRACDDANIAPWHSHQLRHTAATTLRRQFGIETARVILGHRSPVMTDLYAEIDRTTAIKAIQQTG